MDQPTVVLVHNRIANYVVESIPYTLVTGGRRAGNKLAHDGVSRFFADGDPPTLLLDQTDMDYLEQWDIRFIVTEETDTRSLQLLIQTDRFELIDRLEGYLLFRVLNTESKPEDALFSEMNRIASVDLRNDFQPNPSSEWGGVNARWARLLDATPDNPTIRYGLALSLVLSGQDERALPYLQQLHADYPESALLVTTLTEALLRLERSGEANSVLSTAMTSTEEGVRAAVAYWVLQPSTIHQVDDSVIALAANVAETAPAAWELLADYDQADNVRMRSALLASQGFYEEADRELGALPPPEIGPRDLWTRAALRLAGDDVEGALDLLEPYLDLDTLASARYLHPDRWTVNEAAGLYHLLQGDLALQREDFAQAEDHYHQAIEQGMGIAGSVFLARAQGSRGDPNQAAITLSELSEQGEEAAFWAAAAQAYMLNPDTTGTHEPALSSWLDMPANLNGEILSLSSTPEQVGVRVRFGPGSSAGCPVSEWNSRVFDSDDFSLFGASDGTVPALPGALTEMTLTVPVSEVLPFTQAGVAVVTACDGLLDYQPAYAQVTLNPAEADENDIEQQQDYTLGASIHFRGYTVQTFTNRLLQLSIYWETSQPLPEDYQVFVHVIDDSGAIVAQADAMPVSGRYPSSQWSPDFLIGDVWELHFAPPLPDGEYHIRIGLYRLEDLQRLEVSPTDEHVYDHSIDLGLFTVG
jgi:predicted Zn-dependent protease